MAEPPQGLDLDVLLGAGQPFGELGIAGGRAGDGAGAQPTTRAAMGRLLPLATRVRMVSRFDSSRTFGLLGGWLGSEGAAGGWGLGNGEWGPVILFGLCSGEGGRSRQATIDRTAGPISRFFLAIREKALSVKVWRSRRFLAAKEHKDRKEHALRSLRSVAASLHFSRQGVPPLGTALACAGLLKTFGEASRRR